jgi:hypothetical protein
VSADYRAIDAARRPIEFARLVGDRLKYLQCVLPSLLRRSCVANNWPLRRHKNKVPYGV